jgi:hypothetical protein
MNCHFLCMDGKHGSEVSAPEDLRDQLRKIIKGEEPKPGDPICSLSMVDCYQEVWKAPGSDHKGMEEATEDVFDQKGKPRETSLDVVRLTMERGHSCFWYPFQSRMSLEAAKVLERRSADRREAARDRAWVKYGVWVAAIGLLLNFLLGISGPLVQFVRWVWTSAFSAS